MFKYLIIYFACDKDKVTSLVNISHDELYPPHIVMGVAFIHDCQVMDTVQVRTLGSFVDWWLETKQEWWQKVAPLICLELNVCGYASTTT